MSTERLEDDLLRAVARIGARRVLAVGDVMLDNFVYGSIRRISPEAPVPVLRLGETKRMLGGAGNVARNIAALGGEPTLVGLIGADEDGLEIIRLVDEDALIESGLVTSAGRCTTVKTRFVANAQQVLRVDREESAALAADHEGTLIERALARVDRVEAVLLSDYNKGVLSRTVVRRVIEAAARRDRPVIVDPKAPNFSAYAGATCITPNSQELAVATGMPTDSDEEVAAAGRVALEQAQARCILVTRSEKGMSLVLRDEDPIHIPSRAREVFDVSGAGDTVVATLTLAVANGLSWEEAARLANVAAGVVVSKQGTATCTLAELEGELTDHHLILRSKVCHATAAVRVADHWRRRGLSVGFTNGCFDLLHPGHVTLLQQARQHCDRLIVGLNSDASVRRLKGASRPVQNQDARATVLSALGSVDLVTIFDADTPLDLITVIRPDVLIKGADYTIDQVVGAEVTKANGGRVVLIDLVEGQSTTKIIQRTGAHGTA